jgi:hypothetical protein
MMVLNKRSSLAFGLVNRKNNWRRPEMGSGIGCTFLQLRIVSESGVPTLTALISGRFVFGTRHDAE